MRSTGSVRGLLVVVFLALRVALPDAHAAAPAPAVGMRGMVVAAEKHAAAAGLAMLRDGGNAIDAAVATAFALGVTEPYHSGIGGGGFLLMRLADGRVVALDARETAPAAAAPDMYLRPGVAADASRSGPLAIATPGLVAGLAEALAAHGTKPLAEVMAPAIALAEHGFPISLRHARMLEAWKAMGHAARFPETAAIQLPPAGTPIAPGWKLVQPELAKTLRAIAREGPAVFYRGRIGAAIAAEVQKRGGILGADDLAGYATKRREPLRGTYRGLEIVSFPPPSSGGIALVEMLNVLEGFELRPLGAGSSAAIHRIAESMKLAFADRAHYLGDPDFVPVPAERLVSKEYAAALRNRLLPSRLERWPWTWGRDEVAIRVDGPGLGELPLSHGGTTHLSVTDAAGNAVALTQTVNLLFGSGITVAGTGIVLNDEMDDFSVAQNSPNAFGLVDVLGRNAVAPGKRPLSSMTPTLVLEDGRVRIVAGSPGGPRIITTVLLALVNMIDFGLDPSEAIAAPRFHHQWEPDQLSVEAAIPADVLDALRERGHAVKVAERNWSSAQVIAIDPKTGWHLGASDPRSDGAALAY
ncbi:MAG: gamma-glutamyltransferase [Proteobacteria bacterium]|nr:MAG: gamma-glutamyltransferase [Pseudomonadota bacterium]